MLDIVKNDTNRFPYPKKYVMEYPLVILANVSGFIVILQFFQRSFYITASIFRSSQLKPFLKVTPTPSILFSEKGHFRKNDFIALPMVKLHKCPFLNFSPRILLFQPPSPVQRKIGTQKPRSEAPKIYVVPQSQIFQPKNYQLTFGSENLNLVCQKFWTVLLL